MRKTLDELLDYIQPQPYIVHSENYNHLFKTPVLTAGQTFVLGKTNETDGIYTASKINPIILFDDFTTACKWVDFPFKVKSSACKIIIPKTGTNIRYCYYAMKSIKFDAFQHKRYWISQYSKLGIPSYGPQKENLIVDSLDCISSLIEKKKAEISSLDSLVKSRFMEMFGNPMDERKWNSKFTEVVIFNPKKSEVKKDMEIEASFVPMEAIGTDGSFSIKKSGKIRDFYKGYTYFKDGDVIFAKITPCFENGKIAIANHCTNKIGFGTTEFHVARPIPGKTNAEWVMNLLRNDSLHTYWISWAKANSNSFF